MTVSQEVEDDGVDGVEDQRRHHREHGDAAQDAQQTQASDEQQEHWPGGTVPVYHRRKAAADFYFVF